MREFFSAADIRRLAAEGCQYLLLSPDDRITAEALDVARELGVQIHREGDADTAGRPFPKLLNKEARPGKPIKLVKAASVQLEPFAFNVGHPEMNIHVTDIITAEHGSPMAAGFMTWEKGSFPWTLNYDEIDFVIDGQLEIRMGNQVIIGNPGDVIFIPKGSNIFFGSPSYAKVFYVTYPADWDAQ